MTELTRTRLFIGLETSEKNLEIAPEEVINFIKRNIEAGTFYEAQGLWKGDLENSIVFECMEFEDHIKPTCGWRNLEDFKEALEREFNQDSVMVEQTEVEVQF